MNLLVLLIVLGQEVSPLAPSAATPASAPVPPVPLTVVGDRLNEPSHLIEFTLRNDGRRTVVGWMVEVTQSFADGRTDTVFLSVDRWEDAAGLAPPGSREFDHVIPSGASQPNFMRINPRGDSPTTVKVRPVAAILDDGSKAGNPRYCDGIVHGRAREAQALAELLAILESANQQAADSTTAVQLAKESLDCEVHPHPFKLNARSDLNGILMRAARKEVDPAAALEALMENTRLRAAVLSRLAKADLAETVGSPEGVRR